MKTIFLFLSAVVLLMAACGSNDVEVINNVEGDKASVRVHVK